MNLMNSHENVRFGHSVIPSQDPSESGFGVCYHGLAIEALACCTSQCLGIEGTDFLPLRWYGGLTSPWEDSPSSDIFRSTLYKVVYGISFLVLLFCSGITLQGTKKSHLGKRKVTFKSALARHTWVTTWVPRRLVSSLVGLGEFGEKLSFSSF